MAIKEVKREEIKSARSGYVTEIMKEFLDSGFDAALVDIPKGKTMVQVYSSLKNHIRHAKLDNVVCAARRCNKIYLLRK